MLYIFSGYNLVFNETKQIALVLLWEHLSEGKGLAVSDLQPYGKEFISSRRLAVPRIIET